MKWSKLGNIYKPNCKHPKLISHSANPLAMQISEDIFRIYFSGRDSRNRSSVGFFDFDMAKMAVVKECKEPLVTHGKDESYYSHGISIGNVYEDEKGKHILFMGWQIRGNDHWRGDVGKINIIDKDTLEIDSETPFMSVDEVDPVSLSYPWVERDEKGKFHMWYGSTVTWRADNDEMIHVLNYASSLDSITWNKKGLAIPYEVNIAQAFSRPVYWRSADKEHMVFSYRCGTGKKYRIGYANRDHLSEWNLALDQVGIDVGGEGEWDSEMICYPFVFEYKSNIYLLYNGNGHGKSGVGLAKLESY